MKDLKIHAGGKYDYLNTLKEKYEDLKTKLINNKNITEKERIDKLKKINEKFENEKKDLNQKLFQIFETICNCQILAKNGLAS